MILLKQNKWLMFESSCWTLKREQTSLMRKTFVRGEKKYSLAEKKNLGELVWKYTVALDISIKEENNTLYLPWISPLSFFYAKRCLLGQVKWRGTQWTIFWRSTDIPTPLKSEGERTVPMSDFFLFQHLMNSIYLFNDSLSCKTRARSYFHQKYSKRSFLNISTENFILN